MVKDNMYAIVSYGGVRREHKGYYTTFARVFDDTLNHLLADFIAYGDEAEVLEIIYSDRAFTNDQLESRCYWWDEQLALRDKEQDDVQ